MSQYWFRCKQYGFGTYPISWQGWLATLGLVILIMISCYINIPVAEKSLGILKNWLRYGLDVFILATLFLLIVKDKTEGEIKWRGGKETK